MTPKYDIVVKLSGEDGDAYTLMSIVLKELHKHGASMQDLEEFRLQCMAGDFDHTLKTIMRWVKVI
ncbi:hypothetical protein BVL54_19760 [Bacillus paralicheniformis]|nr:hypothetical protein BVL54_19760 [Bacillus paralicheniformis]